MTRKNKYFFGMIMRRRGFPFSVWPKAQEVRGEWRRHRLARRASHCGILEMSIIHTSAGGSPCYRKDIQIHACWFWRSLNACKMHMLIEFDLDGPQGHRAQRSSTSQLHDALNTTPPTPIPLWTGSERENDASVSSAKKKLAVAGKNGRMRKEGRTASE